MTHPDTAPDNPTNTLEGDQMPTAAVLTVLLGGNDRPFCTLGNLYRILKTLDGEVPLADEIDAAVERVRPALAAQFPELAAITPPGIDADEQTILAWIADVERDHGAIQTVQLPAREA